MHCQSTRKEVEYRSEDICAPVGCSTTRGHQQRSLEKGVVKESCNRGQRSSDVREQRRRRRRPDEETRKEENTILYECIRPAGPAQCNRPSENCVKCISKASGSEVGYPLRCNTERCGPYGNTWAYWADCGKPGRSKAHSPGLAVHVYTFCTAQKLALNFQQDPCEELRYFIDWHIGGLFADFPATLTRFLARRGGCSVNNWGIGFSAGKKCIVTPSTTQSCRQACRICASACVSGLYGANGDIDYFA
ncbi:hypothetical protein LSAT2_005628 [Lamellibrachia satsuma]|nr:hypothetical protein LSAT2_005628 [Lamellibrachia satsuma]